MYVNTVMTPDQMHNEWKAIKNLQTELFQRRVPGFQSINDVKYAQEYNSAQNTMKITLSNVASISNSEPGTPANSETVAAFAVVMQQLYQRYGLVQQGRAADGAISFMLSDIGMRKPGIAEAVTEAKKRKKKKTKSSIVRPVGGPIPMGGGASACSEGTEDTTTAKGNTKTFESATIFRRTLLKPSRK